MPKSTPYTVIGGYLGAGKTTLLNNLLRENQGKRIAVMVNDFGSINIDADLIARHDGETIQLANGCICCSLADGFVIALNRLSKQSDTIDHIIVEASGVSDPARLGNYGAILKLEMDGVIVIADAEQIRTRAANKYVGETVVRQLQCAQFIVLNKVDLVLPEELAEVLAWLKALAPDARIIEATFGRVPTAVLLGAQEAPPAAHFHAEPEETAHHDHLYQTASLLSTHPIVRANLQSILDSLPEGILRAKGFVHLQEDPDNRYLLQVVGKRWSLKSGAPWNDDPRETRIVLIGLAGAFDVAHIEALLFAAPAAKQ